MNRYPLHPRSLPDPATGAIEIALRAVAGEIAAGVLPDDSIDALRAEWLRRWATANGFRLGRRFELSTLAAGGTRRARGASLPLPEGAWALTDHGDFLWRDRRPAAVLAHVYGTGVEHALRAAADLGLVVRPLRFSLWAPKAAHALLVTRDAGVEIERHLYTNARQFGERNPVAR